MTTSQTLGAVNPQALLTLLTPIRQGISNLGGTIEVLVRVQAPTPEASSEKQRTPLRLALVIDRSGSMNGQPLTEALRCAAHIASRLVPQDQVAVVTYDTDVQIQFQLKSAGIAGEVESALRDIESGGSTDLFAGWLAGARQLEGSVGQSISRVVLLSDGQANAGIVDPSEISAHCSSWLAKGVSTTTVGLGRGFNEELMIGMAKAGGGQNYYGQTAADLQDSFDEEFSLLQAGCLRDLRVKLIPAPGVIVERLGIVDLPAAAGDDSIRMNDLAYGSESWLLVRLHYNASQVGSVRDLLAASFRAKDAEGAPVEMHTGVLSLPVFGAGDLAAMPVDELVDQRRLELEFAAGARMARQLLMAGNLPAAKEVLDALKLKVAGHAWLVAKVDGLIESAERDAEMTTKELHYASMRMNKLAAFNQSSFSVDETESLSVPAFLRRKTVEGKGKNTGS